MSDGKPIEWERTVRQLASEAYDEIERGTISPERKKAASDGIRAFQRLLLERASPVAAARPEPPPPLVLAPHQIEQLRQRDTVAARPGEPSEARRLVDDQAEDEGLWGKAETAMEAYLQAALRELHDAVERATPPGTPGETP